ncbi:hypothetical protein [Paenibacillus azoreducens]|uniref:hypothetical protein n=1 Tax=Paenibacillus azoreducens TaxID=116718 RepID=UPI001BB398B9|nr:hypothetical protein [Paenibacillus azoreducens]
MGYLLHVLAVGGFGHDFARQLGLRTEPLGITTLSADTTRIDPLSIPDANLNILALWRYSPGLLRQLDEYAFLNKKPWLPVVYNHPFIEVGPVIVPGAGPCYSCYSELVLNNSPTAAYMRQVYAYYDGSPDTGPKGFLHAFAGWAAAIVARLPQCIAGNELPGGWVWKMHVVSRKLYQYPIRSDIGCDRCLPRFS